MQDDILDMNLAVFTTKNVMKNGHTIVRVYYDDGDWQFFDALSTNSPDNAMIVALKEVLQIDPSINSILNLKPGHKAIRTDKDDKWLITVQ